MVCRILLLAAVFAVSASIASAAPKKAPDPRAWPTVYEPADLTVAQLLAAAKRADGGSRGLDTLRITYDVRDGGLTGVERHAWHGDDYRTDTTLGPFITAAGRYKGDRWELGENGYTLLKRGIHQRAEVNARALERESPGDDVQVLGRLREPLDAYVLRVSPKGGRDERRFYDARTFHLIRRETPYLQDLVVTTYDDYRTAAGITQAYRTTYSDGHPENDSVATIREVATGGAVTDADLAIPPGRRLPVTFPDGVATVRLPARIDQWGAVIVRLVINGRGLDFQLDSGCSSIVLDRAVARQLGLPIYGHWSQTVAGTFTSAKTIVPKLSVGPIVMTDVVVDALPFTFANDDHTKVVGLLGFDFLAGGVFKIDYEHGTVDAMPYDADLPKDALVVDAVLDDAVPMVPLAVNGVVGERFILDTGAEDVVLFSGFAQQHPEIVTDHSPGKIVSRMFNLVSSQGVGGTLSTRALLLEKLKLGPVTFTDFFSEVMSGNQPAFEGEDTDGLIGASVLSAFDVYFDYANSRIGFAVNDSAKHHRAARGFASQR